MHLRKHSRGTRKEIQAEITDAGGTNISNARGNCTALVTTPQEVKKPTRKISDARVLGIPIVSEDGLAACLREVEQVDTSAYLLEGWPLAPSTGPAGERRGTGWPYQAHAHPHN